MNYADNEPLLTVEEIANHLKVPKSWVYEKARLKQIPLIKAGKYLRFRASEVEKAMAMQTKKNDLRMRRS